jgi:hypothetical protein
VFFFLTGKFSKKSKFSFVDDTKIIIFKKILQALFNFSKTASGKFKSVNL